MTLFRALLALAHLMPLVASQASSNMVYTELPAGLSEVDVIIVGGGTAGSVIAARLADANTSASILVIEGGPDNYNNPIVIYPALYRANFGATSKNFVVYAGGKEEQLGNRSVILSAGSVLGGGSSVNGAIYARGQAVDYDSWKTAGWSSDDLVPFLEKLETYHPCGKHDTHGSDGPVDVSDGPYLGKNLRTDFISAFNDIGYSYFRDLQDLETNDGVSHAHRYVDPDTGKRQDAAHRYLQPRIRDGSHPNLYVLVQTQVTRVLFDANKRASGVEFRPNPAFGSTNSTTLTVKARKLVIASSGALGTPQLLERSGVGSAQVLKTAGVPIVSDLAGVGSSYQDHQMVLVTYNSSLSVEESVDSVINGALSLPELLATNAKILGWNGVDASSKLRPTEAEIAKFSPSLRKIWDRDYANNPTKPLGSLVLVAGVLGDPSIYPSGQQYFSIGCYSPYPYSRGHVHITGPNLGDALDLKTGYLSDADNVDVQILTWLYKKQREVARNMRLQLGQVSKGPEYDSASPAATVPEAGEITYSQADNLAIEKWVKETVATAYHAMGTGKMAPKAKSGVVDASLNVYGVKGLKVADMSIAPENVSANTMNTALLIGEKAADIFIKELCW